jgi:hypothetical protein
MKSVKITNIGDIRNEPNRYRRGRKFDIVYCPRDGKASDDAAVPARGGTGD